VPESTQWESGSDLRYASSDDIRRLVDQGQANTSTIQALVATLNDHDKRITVLEVTANFSKSKVEEIRATGKEMVRALAEHTQQEDKDRQRLLIGVVSTLLAVLGGIAMIIGSQVNLFGGG